MEEGDAAARIEVLIGLWVAGRIQGEEVYRHWLVRGWVVGRWWWDILCESLLCGGCGNRDVRAHLACPKQEQMCIDLASQVHLVHLRVLFIHRKCALPISTCSSPCMYQASKWQNDQTILFLPFIRTTFVFTVNTANDIGWLYYHMLCPLFPVAVHPVLFDMHQIIRCMHLLENYHFAFAPWAYTCFMKTYYCIYFVSFLLLIPNS